MISATVNKRGKNLYWAKYRILIVALDRESISYGFNCSFGAKNLFLLLKAW